MISIIVATDDDLLIGKKDSKNGMPWHNKEDLQHFKKTTLNRTILMGKTTYLAIGRPLPNRKTIVVTKSGLDDERVEVRNDLIEAPPEIKMKIFISLEELLFINKLCLMLMNSLFQEYQENIQEKRIFRVLKNMIFI